MEQDGGGLGNPSIILDIKAEKADCVMVLSRNEMNKR